MKNHTELLNYLISTHKLASYLEIGVSIPANNFNLIHAKSKIGVDPNPRARANFCGTSDVFFGVNHKTFDLIFIDGLHHADQVKRDFDNSLKVLNPGGYIVLHDTNPEAELLTHVPRDKRGRWLGDVYKFICLLNEYDGIDFHTVDFDNGCTIVWRDESKKGTPLNDEITWDYFDNHRELLRLVEVSELILSNS